MQFHTHIAEAIAVCVKFGLKSLANASHKRKWRNKAKLSLTWPYMALHGLRWPPLLYIALHDLTQSQTVLRGSTSICDSRSACTDNPNVAKRFAAMQKPVRQCKGMSSYIIPVKARNTM